MATMQGIWGIKTYQYKGCYNARFQACAGSLRMYLPLIRGDDCVYSSASSNYLPFSANTTFLLPLPLPLLSPLQKFLPVPRPRMPDVYHPPFHDIPLPSLERQSLVLCLCISNNVLVMNSTCYTGLQQSFGMYVSHRTLKQLRTRTSSLFLCLQTGDLILRKHSVNVC